MLRIRVDGPDGLGARLAELGGEALTVADEPDVAFVLAAGGTRDDADAVLTDDADLRALVTGRLLPWAAALAAGRYAAGPAVLAVPDPAWAPAAVRRLARVRAALGHPADGWAFDHIGSTSVPGLAAKPSLDLQVLVPALPEAAALDAALARAGFLAEHGSRPDSPGVTRDEPRGDEDVPDDVWRKRLFVCPDPVSPSVLHVRLAASPWGRHTVAFRDWLRAHPAERDRYEQLKRALAAEHAGSADYDDYTRAKSSWITEALPRFDAWARGR